MKPSGVEARIRVLILARVPRSGVLGAFLNPVADKESNTRGNLFLVRAFVFLLRRKAVSFLCPYFGYSSYHLNILFSLKYLSPTTRK